MKLYKIFFVLVVMLNFFSITFAEKNDQLTIKISKNLRCVICQGQSIYDSNSDFALSVKTLVSEKLESGKNEKDIYNSCALSVFWSVYVYRAGFKSYITYI